MALNPSNSSNLEQLALKGVNLLRYRAQGVLGLEPVSLVIKKSSLHHAEHKDNADDADGTKRCMRTDVGLTVTENHGRG